MSSVRISHSVNNFKGLLTLNKNKAFNLYSASKGWYSQDLYNLYSASRVGRPQKS